MKKIIIYLLIFLFPLSGCGKNIFKRSDIKDNPVNVNERVKRNIEQGKGIRFGKGSASGGTFDFVSSNELWRASIDVLDFVPFTNARLNAVFTVLLSFDVTVSALPVRFPVTFPVTFPVKAPAKPTEVRIPVSGL